MKKFIIILLVAVVAGSAVFAADFSIGVMQNYLHTSVIADLDINRFIGVEGSVGIPLVSGVVGTIDYISRGGIDPDTGEKEDFDIVGMFLLPAGMINTYIKPVSTDHFEWRLNLQIDAISLMDDDHFTFIAVAGVGTGLEFKFNSGFSVNLSGAIPLAAFLPEEAAQYTLFYYTTKTEDNWDFLMILPLVVNQFARISLKWSI